MRSVLAWARFFPFLPRSSKREEEREKRPTSRERSALIPFPHEGSGDLADDVESYHPKRPYIFRSGKMKGLSLEKLLFLDYDYLHSLKERLEKERDCATIKGRTPMEIHLEWVLDRAEKVETKMECPHCKEWKVKYFLLYSDRRGKKEVSPYYTSCEKEGCLEELRHLFSKVIDSKGKGELLPFRFSVLKNFTRKEEKRKVRNLFKRTFGLPKQARKEHIFDLLKEVDN